MGALNTLTAVEAVNQIAAKKITAEAVVRDCLERIRMREIEVMAWQHIDGERAIERARAADAAGNPGLLRGLPVGVKDLIDTIDMPATYGSPIYQNHRPAWDAPCVALTRAAGGIVLGKTAVIGILGAPRGYTEEKHCQNRHFSLHQ